MYADVIVDISAEKLDKTFQYSIPENLAEDVFIGVQVVVPFGNRKEGMTGFVVDISEEPKIDTSLIKDIRRVLKDSCPVETELIALAAYMKKYFGGTMNQALKTVLPVKKIEKHKYIRIVRLNMTQEEAASFEEECRRKGYVARMRLISELRQREHIQYELLTTKLNVSSSVIKAMEDKGYITVEKTVDIRNNLPVGKSRWDKVTLNDDQLKVVEAIESGRDKSHLIRGVTGSGKTEVYIELIKRAVARGQKAIVLIPEIALTFQTVSRFYDHFGERVSVIHSKLSKGEKYDRFECAKNGDLDVMIGPRSALFTPFKDLGYIIIHVPHNHRHLRQANSLSSMSPSVTGDDLVLAVIRGPRNQWRQYAKHGNTLCSSEHGFILNHLEGMVLEGNQLCNRDLLDPVCLFFFIHWSIPRPDHIRYCPLHQAPEALHWACRSEGPPLYQQAP